MSAGLAICLVCGEPLDYFEEAREVACHICGKKETGHSVCTAGHYVCDVCHREGGVDHVTEYCSSADSRNPVEMAMAMMDDKSIFPNGPEHHTLVGAALLAAGILVPIYLQSLMGYSATVSGLVLLPGAIIMGAMGPIAGRLFDRRGPRVIGIIGTGRIGAQVVRNLSGFGCRILAYDLRRNPAVEPQVTYVDFDTLLAQSDVITLHMPLLDSNRHIINRESIAKMRDGVVIVNCSRGELADIEALIEGIETGKIGALGMDTVEGDEGIIHADHRVDILPNRNWFYLHQFRNVIMTQHMAFYTDAAVSSMVDCGIGGICQMAAGESCPTELTGPVQ